MSAFFKSPACPILAFADATALRAEPSALLRTGTFGNIDGATDLVRYDSTETGTDDGINYWIPDDVDPGDPGRWVLFAIGGGAAGPDFTDPVLHVNENGAVPSAGLYGLSVFYTAGAARKGLFWDPVNATWTCSEDTLGDDTTISAYLPLRVLDLKTPSVSSTTSGIASTGLLRMGTADEIRARVGSDYRLAAALAGPILAFGDATAATTTIDAAGTLRATVASGTIDLRAGALTIKSADGVTTLLTATVSGGTFVVTGTASASTSLKTPTLDTIGATALTVGGTATSVAFSGLALTSVLSVASATTLTLTAVSGALAADASAAATFGAATATSLSFGHDAIVSTHTGVADFLLVGIANTVTSGRKLRNTTASTSVVTVQRTPQDLWEGHARVSSADRTFLAAFEMLPKTSGNLDLLFKYDTAGAGTLSTAFRYTTSTAGQFTAALECSAFSCTGADGYFFDNDYSGMHRVSGGVGVKLYNGDGTQPLTVSSESEINLQTAGATTRVAYSVAGAITETLPVSIVRRTIWGTKCFRDETANFGTTTDAATATAITTYSAADESVYRVRAVFTAWVNGADYGGFERQATFKRDGGTLAIEGVSTTVGTDGVSAGIATATCAIDASGTTIRGVVNGVISTTISWSCKLEIWGETP